MKKKDVIEVIKAVILCGVIYLLAWYSFMGL